MSFKIKNCFISWISIVSIVMTPIPSMAITQHFLKPPSAMNYSQDLHHQLLKTQKEKLGQYTVRTKYRNNDGSPQYVNRLILEDSPYLLQHAHNPVNWYAWGDEAFVAAKKLNLPVFLSIGYSTCHWCHVMEKESFDDLEVAQYLNQNFICIKVDREQRPDLDDIYMTAVQMFTGRGGWPMSNFLTTEAQPFYGGTYFPKQQFLQLLKQVTTAWNQNHQQVIETSKQVTTEIALYRSQSQKAQILNQDTINKTVNELLNGWDEKNGGFNFAPKFPQETYLLLLLDQLQRKSDPKIHTLIEVTLHKMAQGGIYDQVGGGFHRYSTDEKWLIPHFEKMLYNQALLGQVYTEAFQLTGNQFYKRIAEEIFEYVIRDMQDKNGGFYSATDADSEDVEGTFYLWTEDEIKKILPNKQAQLALKIYGLTKTVNFKQKNILHLKQSIDDFAEAHHFDKNKLLNTLTKIKLKLYQTREKRIHPHTDKKIITAWNGMMMSSLVEASEVLNQPEYLQQAIKTAHYLWQVHLNKNKGYLMRSSLNGKSSVNATLEDYAYYAEALIKIYDRTEQSKWLARAEKISQKMIELFEDSKGGFFNSVSYSDTPQITRIKSANDDAIPSANAKALSVLLQLYHRTGNTQYKNKLNAALSTFSGNVVENPVGYASLLRVVSNKENGETGAQQYFSGGVVRAKIIATSLKMGTLHFDINLHIKKGWHINSNKPLNEKLIATQLMLDSGVNGSLKEVRFPKAQLKELSFEKKPLSLFEQDITIKGKILLYSKEVSVPVKLKLQACNETLCQLPQIRTLTLHLTK